jgi:hypothetical protein
MASTNIDYERWHDGVPYDLDALRELTGAERDAAEAWLLARADRDWRDLEGLLALGSARARAAVVGQLRGGTLEMRLSAARLLGPDPTLAVDREAAIIAGLGEAAFGSGLKDALDLAVAEPTPAVIDALFRAALRKESAVHAGAALAYLHGHAKEPFDMARRPFFLQLVDADPAVRRGAFEALCRECGVDPARYPG